MIDYHTQERRRQLANMQYRRLSLGKRILFAFLTAYLAMWMAGCSQLSPMTPDAVTTHTLTVRVFTYGTSEPISGALVESPGGLIHLTNSEGITTFDVVDERDTTIRASATGYHASSASGVIRSAERWTFWLLPIGE
jgi:hypothetical protein